MYNYGVVENSYIIVMKRYDCSLRDWILVNKERLTNKLNTRKFALSCISLYIDCNRLYEAYAITTKYSIVVYSPCIKNGTERKNLNISD